MNLTELLLSRHAEVKALAVLDVVVDGRLERTAGETAREV